MNLFKINYSFFKKTSNQLLQKDKL